MARRSFLESVLIIANFLVFNKEFFLSCTFAWIVAFLIPQTRQVLLIVLLRIYRYYRLRPIRFLVIFYCFMLPSTFLLLHFGVVSAPPMVEVVYVKLDSKNGTETRITPQEYSSISSQQMKASGLSGPEWARAQAEEISAFHASKSHYQVHHMSEHPETSTIPTARVKFLL